MLLVRELAAAAPAAAAEFLPAVAELAGLDGFAHCCHLQASSNLRRGFVSIHLCVSVTAFQRAQWCHQTLRTAHTSRRAQGMFLPPDTLRCLSARTLTPHDPPAL